jgi:hypothetical protein
VSERRSLATASGLTEREISALRALLLRRRLNDAEVWLRRHGISDQRAERILTEQEMAIAGAVYADPKWHVFFALLFLSAGAILLAAAVTAEQIPGQAPLIPDGPRRTALIALMVAPLFIASFLFALQATRQILRHLRARLRYRLRSDPEFRF